MTSDQLPPAILISGGSRGLGGAITSHLLAAGYSVATFSRSLTPLVTGWLEDHALRDRFMFQELDNRDAVGLRSFVSAAHERFQRIDALINNAAVAHDGVLGMMTEDRIDQMLDVNLKAALLLSKECSRLMLLQDAGHIINISSVIAQRGFAGLSVYAATKAGLEGMTRALARELGPRNIRVNAIAPGYLETDMSQGLSDEQRAQIVRRTPLGRLGRAEDVLPWIDLLLCSDSDFVTGQVITVDGGATA